MPSLVLAPTCSDGISRTDRCFDKCKKRTKKELQVNQCSSTSSETVRQTKVQSVLSFIIIHQHVLKYLRDESVAEHLSLSAGQSKQAETS